MPRTDAHILDRLHALEQRVEALEARVELGARALAWDALVFVSVKECASKLKMSESRIRIWIRKGWLPSLRIGKTVRVPAWWLTAKVAAAPEVREELLLRVARARSREAGRSASAALQERARRALEAQQDAE